MSDAPGGTVTFLFTDIVGSSRLWERFPGRMGAALARHDEILRAAIEACGGHVFKTVGDAFCAAFPTPRSALQAAIDAQRALGEEPWGDLKLTVRMGLHTGTAEFRDGDYFGNTLNRSARIQSAAHGGQILLSQVTCGLLEDEHLGGGHVHFKPLGSHRLRNLDRPEQLFQVVAPGLREEFPPPRSMEVLPNNLPAQTTSFVGREREMERILDLLRKARLVTLFGTGGTGKSRLALEVGARLIQSFRDGAWLVELAPITDPDRVVEGAASALGAHHKPERSPRETLIQFLRGKQLLLILDNCEHVLSVVSDLVSAILRLCPDVRILATSRHSLQVPGEVTFGVPPLAMFDVRLQDLSGPDIAERLTQYEAVKLFIERATAVRPDFQVTNANAPALAEICSRLDGIPLAIELAAARASVLDLHQIAARLDDRFRLLRHGGRAGTLPHQQTLQALIDWSHDLLTDQERRLFRRLGAFVGGRTLDALERVCAGDGIEDFEVLDILQQLVNKSLVNVEHADDGPPRYTMIESVWHYARERLDADPEADACRDRHLEYFLEFAEAAAPGLRGPSQRQWLDRCQREALNLRVALNRSIRTGRAEHACRFINALHRFYEVRGSLPEARAFVKRIIPMLEQVVPAVRADFLLSAGRLAWASDDLSEARECYARSEALHESLGNEPGAALAGALQAFVDRGDGLLESAENRFRRAVEVATRHEDLFLKAVGLSGLGSIALDRGDLAAARTLKEQGLAACEPFQDHWTIGLMLWGLTQVTTAQRDHDRARSILAQWAAITRDLGNQWILPYMLDCVADLALDEGDARRAARCHGAAGAVRRHFGSRLSPGEQARHEAFLRRLGGMLPAPEIRAEREAGEAQSPWLLVAGR